MRCSIYLFTYFDGTDVYFVCMILFYNNEYLVSTKMDSLGILCVHCTVAIFCISSGLIQFANVH